MRRIGPGISTALAVGLLGSMTITWGGQWGGSTRHMGQWAKSGLVGWHSDACYACECSGLRLYWLARGRWMPHTPQSHIAPSLLWWCSHRPLGNLNKHIVGISGISTLCTYSTYIRIYHTLGTYVRTCTTHTHREMCTYACMHACIHSCIIIRNIDDVRMHTNSHTYTHT